MPTSPLPHHMRAAALQCNFEGGEAETLRVPALWADVGFNVEQLFHAFSELYSAVFEKDRHGALMGRYLAETAAHGLQVIVYMNSHILLESQNGRAGEWAEVGPDGTYTTSYGTYYAPCLNSNWCEYFMACIEGLAEFDIAGIFFDGPASGRCFCPRCAAVFEADQGVPLDAATPAQLDAFALRTRSRFIRRCYDKVRQVNPAWVSYINANLMHSGLSAAEMAELLSCNDIIGTEGGFQFYGPPRGTDIWRCGQSARMIEAVAGDKPGVVFMAGDHKPWSWYLHTPAETKLCYASTLANGCSVWYGIHSSTDTLVGSTADAVREMVQFDKQHAALYEHTDSAADVALFYSLDTAKHYTRSGEETDFYDSAGRVQPTAIGNYSESFQGAYAALFRSGIAFDLVTELTLDDLARYRVLVLPTAACMSERATTAIREFVAAGGTIIADSETALYNDTFVKQNDFLLADVFGASFRGCRPYQLHDYFTVRPAPGPGRGPWPTYIPAPTVAVDFEPTSRATILGKLFPPLAGRYAGRPATPEYPFIVRNVFGTGVSYYVGGTFFELYRTYGIPHYRYLVQDIVARHSQPLAHLIDAPESVEFTVRRSRHDDSLLVHLVNYTGGMTRPITSVTPLHGLTLQLPPNAQSVRALVAGRDLAADADNRVSLPELREYEVLLVT